MFHTKSKQLNPNLARAADQMENTQNTWKTKREDQTDTAKINVKMC